MREEHATNGMRLSTQADVQPWWQNVQRQGFLQHDKPKLVDLLPQICGGKLRWQLYHEVHLVERCAKRLHGTAQLSQPAVAPGGPGWHPLNAHVAALLPSLLRLTRCLHAAWSTSGMPLTNVHCV